MAKASNIVHRYFKKKLPEQTILVKVNPIALRGTEITIFNDNTTTSRNLEFDEYIWDDLEHDGFEESSPLEFNLYDSGLA